ncbi:MAG: MerC protein [Gemmatimonadetes bacterium]|nr:MerC protein [Gemmatimonadota bacterium]
MHTERLDKAASATSIACAVHCALSPLVLPLLPLAAGHIVGPALEWTFVMISLVLGTSSLTHSFRVVHRDWRALLLFTAGFAVLLSVRVAEPPGTLEALGVFGAASLLVAAHVLNLRLGRSHREHACRCACHQAEAGSAEESAHAERALLGP